MLFDANDWWNRIWNYLKCRKFLGAIPDRRKRKILKTQKILLIFYQCHYNAKNFISKFIFVFELDIFSVSSSNLIIFVSSFVITSFQVDLLHFLFFSSLVFRLALIRSLFLNSLRQSYFCFVIFCFALSQLLFAYFNGFCGALYKMCCMLFEHANRLRNTIKRLSNI